MSSTNLDLMGKLVQEKLQNDIKEIGKEIAIDIVKVNKKVENI